MWILKQGQVRPELVTTSWMWSVRRDITGTWWSFGIRWVSDEVFNQFFIIIFHEQHQVCEVNLKQIWILRRYSCRVMETGTLHMKDRTLQFHTRPPPWCSVTSQNCSHTGVGVPSKITYLSDDCVVFLSWFFWGVFSQNSPRKTTLAGSWDTLPTDEQKSRSCHSKLWWAEKILLVLFFSL